METEASGRGAGAATTGRGATSREHAVTSSEREEKKTETEARTGRTYSTDGRILAGMDSHAFLADIEGLTHTARHRRMVELGRSSRADESARSLLTTLAASDDAYARSLVVTSLHGSRDAALALTLTRDPSRIVRRRVARVVPILCDDAQAVEALTTSDTPRARLQLVVRLRRRRRLGPIDTFYGAAAFAEDKTLVDGLPLASEAAVKSAAKILEDTSSPTAWLRLVKTHPTHFLGWARAQLGAKPGHAMTADPRLRWRMTAVAKAFTKRDPASALELFRLLLGGDEDPGSPIVRAMVTVLLRTYPRETFDILRERHERGQPTRPPGALGIMRLDRVAHRLGADRLVYVVEHAWSTLSDGRRAKRWFLRLGDGDREAVLAAWLSRGRGGWGGFLLRHVPAEGPRAAQREKAYLRWSVEAQNNEGVISVDTLSSLPADLRHREAHRHLDLPVLSTRQDVRNSYASLLPFAEAQVALASFIGHPEGEERAKAMRVLIGTVLHEPESTTAALAAIRARKFEQDPVRLAMIDALAALPVRRFTAAHLEDVGAIVGDALDAADLSYGTASAAERLVVRLFRVDALWGANWLTTILQKRGSLSAVGGLADALLPSDVDRLAPGLVELSKTWMTQERSGTLLWLATSLGIRLPRVPALLDALEHMSREQPFVAVAALSLALLRKHAPKRFATMVPELLAVDPSYVVVDAVATFVSVHRQDLLGPFLSGTPMTGRFATGRTTWAIRFARGHGRWTSRLQVLHSAAWTRLLGDEKRDVPTLISAIAALAELAFAPRDALLPFASDPRQAVRETAIRALPWLDSGQGVPVLLACLADDRARYAIYALRKAFSEMPRARVLAYLRDAPTTKVTVAKEVVRLLGDLGGSAAFAELLAFDAKPDLHRDVRIALLRALWDHLDREETWPVFERAVSHTDWVVASKLADIPLGRLSTTAQDRVVDLLVRILGRPEPEARLDLLRRCAYLPVTDAKRTLLGALVKHLGVKRPDEALAAAQAVIVRMRAGEVDLVIARLRELAPRRDLMVVLVPAFAPHTYSPAHLRTLAESLVTLLARDPLATTHYIRFAGRVLGWKELCAVLEDLAARDFMHSDAMIAACGAIAGAVSPASIESRFAKHANPRLRRLGLEALKHASSPRDGWSRERREKLEEYRRDPAPLVAGEAVYVFPPDPAAKEKKDPKKGRALPGR